MIKENPTLYVDNNFKTNQKKRFWDPTSVCDLCTMQTVSCIVQDCCHSPRVYVLSPLMRGLPRSHLGHVVRPRAPARQHGSDAVKCHFAVAQRNSELLQGLIHGGGKQMEQESQLKVTQQGSWVQSTTAAFILNIRGLYSYYVVCC